MGGDRCESGGWRGSSRAVGSTLVLGRLPMHLGKRAIASKLAHRSGLPPFPGMTETAPGHAVISCCVWCLSVSPFKFASVDV
eukprot:3813589-Amphidinium_carterae.1